MTTTEDPGSKDLPPGMAADEFTRLRPSPAASGAATGPVAGRAPEVTAPGGTAAPSGGSGGWRRWAESEQQAARIGVGDTLRERFVLEEAVGEGGMGLVFRARDRRREEARDRNPFVAIKVLGEEFKRHPDSLIALQREARRMQQLSHPNIAAVYDFDRDGAHVYLVMELLEGESLDRALARTGGALPLDQARRVIESAGAALHHAHSRGVVHSDFKPANVFLTRGGEVKVIDFGIARIAQSAAPGGDSTLTVFDAGELGAFTNAYASPEQMLAVAPPDPRDDVYAFGLVAYEALAGRHPFSRKSAVEARFREMKVEPVPGLNAAQNAALAASLAFERERRLDNVMDLVRAFQPPDERIVATRDAPQSAGTPGAAAERARRPLWRTAAVAVAGVAWIAFFAFYWSARQDEAGSAPTAEPAAATEPGLLEPAAGMGADAALASPAGTRAATAGAIPPAAGATPRTTGAAPAAAPERRAAQDGAGAERPLKAATAPVAATVAAPGEGADLAAASAAADAEVEAPVPAGAPTADAQAALDTDATPAGDTPEAGAPAELYRWVDREGNVKFGEQPPAEYASSAVRVVGY